MTSKLNGAAGRPADRFSPDAYHLGMRAIDAENAARLASLKWTQAAQQSAADLRHKRIAIAAYQLAESRGFAPGHEADDWSLAQALVDALDAAR